MKPCQGGKRDETIREKESAGRTVMRDLLGKLWVELVKVFTDWYFHYFSCLSGILSNARLSLSEITLGWIRTTEYKSCVLLLITSCVHSLLNYLEHPKRRFSLRNRHTFSPFFVCFGNLRY